MAAAVEVAWYEHHLWAGSQRAGGTGEDTEATTGELWNEAAEANPDRRRLGDLATAVTAMQWNTHLLEPLHKLGWVPNQPFSGDTHQLRATLDSVGAGANPMPFPRPDIGACDLEGRTPVMTDRGLHTFEHVLVVAEDRAYGFVRNLQSCIYGRVVRAIELRPNPEHAAATSMIGSAAPGQQGGLFFGSGGGRAASRSAPPPRWYITGTQVAIKCIERSRYETHMQRHAGRLNEDPIKELAVMQHIGRHGGAPHVLPLEGCYANDGAVYAILPYCPNGDLFKLVETGGRLDEPRAFAYFEQIIKGLAALHALGLAHHDMSLENLMLDQSTAAVIIDFGMGVKVASYRTAAGKSRAVPLRARNGWPCRCGKLLYMAPEYFTPSRPVDVFAADIWACGIILFLLLTGMPPWDPGVGPTDTDRRYQYVRDGRLRELLQVWHVPLSEAAMNLLQRLLTVSPDLRIDLAGVHAHPWWLNRGGQ